MADSRSQTASFMVRFNQKIFEDGSGTPDVQWRGRVSHVQGGESQSFTDFEDVVAFIQNTLGELTKQSVEDKSIEEQEGILNRSLEFWKKWSTTAPKLVIDTIKDPKKQVTQIQDQIQGQISHVSDEITTKIEGAWPAATKADVKKIMDSLDQIGQRLSDLSERVDALSSEQ